MANIGDITLEDLRRFIEDTLDARLTRMLAVFEVNNDARDEDGLTWDEVRSIVRQRRWTPPAGAVSSLQFLREDRDI